ncbi:MAG: COR domain-containing protein, partial [Pseudomonadota bacterium]
IGAAGAAHLAGLTALTTLTLAYNEIGAAGAAHLAGLTALTELDLADNGIGDAGAAHLAGLTALTTLNLSRNGIGAAGAAHLAGLTALTRLDLADNGIGDISSLLPLDRLQKIDLSRNPIETPCPAFWRRPALEQAVLFQASLGDTPPEILSQSPGENCLPRLREYLDDLDKGPPQALRDVKVMILGNGQIGKTQLRRRLVGDPYDPKVKSTHGAELDEALLPDAGGVAPRKPPSMLRRALEFLGPAPEPQGTPLKIWDFGGQDIYLGTHALFLRTRAVFPIVWTPAAEPTDAGSAEHLVGGVAFRNYPLDFWVRYVATLGGKGSPVMLVQSQCDEPGMERAPPISAELQDSFRFRPLEIPYSAKTGRGQDMLLAQLRAAIDWLRKQRGATRIGQGWAAVKTEIERLQAEDRKIRKAADRRHRTMDFEIFQKICRDKNGPSDEAGARVLLRFLHDLGAVYHAAGSFDGKIILDQQWALDAIYAVFDREREVWRKIQARGGRFRRSELGDWLWNAAGFELREQELFVKMMQDCAICFQVAKPGPIEDEPVYVALDLLPERSAVEPALADRWDTDGAVLEARFSFKLTPPTLLRGLMATLGEKAGPHAVYWREGMHFRDETTGARARVEAELSEEDWAGDIVLRAQGGDAAALLERLAEAVEADGRRIGVTPDAATRPETRAVDEARRPQAESGEALDEVRPGPEPVIAPECFISYAHGDDSPEGQARAEAFDRVRARLEALSLKPVFDKQELRDGGSIGAFVDRVGRGSKLVAIVSARYLERPRCMQELTKFYRFCGSDDAVFRERCRAVVLDDAPIYGPEDRRAIEKHWRSELERYDRLSRAGPLPLGDHEDFLAIRDFHQTAAHIVYLIHDMIHTRGLDAIETLRFD